MFKIRRKLLAALLLAAVLRVGVPAQEFEQNRSGLIPGAGLPCRADLEAFVDGLMAAQMREGHIAGAVFTAVADGRILMSKGYGFADVAQQRPVTAGRTLFRVASISKLITWTAVMQLVEQGRLDLDADINTYLEDFRIPDAFPQPITLSHLMTHTAGFEEKAAGTGARTERDIVPLGRHLARVLPARVRPPGELSAYSNYGAALAGYIVEIVSGIPFEEYVEKNIFQPLDMPRSTFRQPLPERLKPDMSIGYLYRTGDYQARDFEWIKGLIPAGSMSAPAEDMAHFMIAHLQNGAFRGARMLKEKTARRMHGRLFSHDGRLDGNAHGFWEKTINGIRWITHGGDTRLFHSLLALAPEMNFGFFVSTNSAGGGGPFRTLVLRSILDRCFPAPPPIGEISSFSPRSSKRFAGHYLRTRANSSSFEKIGWILSQIAVRAVDGGELLIFAGEEATRWEAIDEGLFRRKGGDDLALFRINKAGRATHLFFGGTPQIACIRLPPTRTPGFLYLVVGLCVFVFLSTLAWPLNALRRKICGCPEQRHEVPRAARPAALAASGSSLLFLIGAGCFLSDPGLLTYEIPLIFKALLVLPLAAALGGLPVLVFAARAWIGRWWTWCDRVHYTLVPAALALFLWFLNFWNLLGFRF